MLRIRQPQLGGTSATAYTLTAAQGSFTFTGQDATLPPVAHVVAADYGSFALSGEGTNLTSTAIPPRANGGAFGWYPPKLVKAAKKKKKGLKDLDASDVRDLYEIVVEGKQPIPDAAKAAVVAATPKAVPVVPRPEQAPVEPETNWEEVAANAMATRALLQAYQQMLDEQDALSALLLA
jgi:hypothetical protein